MYSILTYPLDVIKTNRIIQSSLSKEGAESIPKEFQILYEKGGLGRGLFRGLFISVVSNAVLSNFSSIQAGIVGGLALSVLTNPF